VTANLADLVPTRLERGVPSALGTTGATATLLRYHYGRRLKPDGKDALDAYADVEVAAGNGSETVRMTLYETREVLGMRLHVRGFRSAVLLYVLPSSPTPDERVG